MTRRDEADGRPAAATPDDEMLACVQEGKQALAAGDLKGALAAFQQVVEAFPDRPEGHNNLGALYAAIGEYARAEACFDQVLAILPDHPNVLYNRGIVRSRRQDGSAAVDDFARVVELCPDDGDAWNNLGVSLFTTGDVAAAHDHFVKALELKPDDANAVLNLCDAELALARPETAVEHARRYLADHAHAEVRRKLVDMLTFRAQATLAEASREAESLLADGENAGELRTVLGRLLQARDALQPRAMEAAGG